MGSPFEVVDETTASELEAAFEETDGDGVFGIIDETGIFAPFPLLDYNLSVEMRISEEDGRLQYTVFLENEDESEIPAMSVKPELPDHLELIARTNERGRVFVQSDTDGEWVVSQRRQQASKPVAFAKMLVDDKRIGQSQAGRHRDHVGHRRTPFLAARDHVLGHERSTGRGAGHVHAVGVTPANQLRDSGASQCRR